MILSKDTDESIHLLKITHLKGESQIDKRGSYQIQNFRYEMSASKSFSLSFFPWKIVIHQPAILFPPVFLFLCFMRHKKTLSEVLALEGCDNATTSTIEKVRYQIFLAKDRMAYPSAILFYYLFINLQE